ncbi:alpha/beta fold hydrolase [Jiangella aurantiaca]|uniref:Alpha/beta fold hydrolase n=1 Tax=Jiangella aurantiaca TaxID=2530373 RepID=A0A4R5AB98_9ACTN|nr:alpha/beta fold hydrolase [Jiangella aurantiaca]TDD68945.1 alpha/beta fold hydrolase [Jiangella aurantiaca]
MRKLPTRHVSTDVLDVAVHGAGPADGPPVVLLHGYPYDIHSYVDVAPALAESGYRVVVPYLRGHGPTRFRRPDTARSGQQAALGADVVDLLDALAIDRAVLAGYDWGGRAACVAAALWPDRVDVVIHSYRHRLEEVSGAPEYAEAEAALALAPAITVPAITLDGTADGNFPATDGSSGAAHFTGPRLHRLVPDAGHNLPQEAPGAFADAVRDVSELAARKQQKTPV